MNEWTPGPWRFHFFGDAKWRVEDQEGWLIAYVRGGNNEIDKANARLIAAAPTLAAQVKRLVEHIEKFGLCHPDDGSQWWPVLDEEKAMLEAIGEKT